MWFTLARSKRYSPGPARLAPGVRAVCSDMFSSAGSLFGLFGRTLRDVHDHPGEQIEPRLDRINVDILGVVRMRAEPAQAEPLDHRRLGFQCRKGRVGAAAF